MELHERFTSLDQKIAYYDKNRGTI
jgi:hypothetical protein